MSGVLGLPGAPFGLDTSRQGYLIMENKKLVHALRMAANFLEAYPDKEGPVLVLPDGVMMWPGGEGVNQYNAIDDTDLWVYHTAESGEHSEVVRSFYGGLGLADCLLPRGG